MELKIDREYVKQDHPTMRVRITGVHDASETVTFAYVDSVNAFGGEFTNHVPVRIFEDLYREPIQKVVCCVCDAVTVDGDPGPVSHGYCKPCAKAALAEVKEAPSVGEWVEELWREDREGKGV